MKKKVLSLVLAAVMLSTSVDMTAFASQASDVDSAVFMEEDAEETAEAVDKLLVDSEEEPQVTLEEAEEEEPQAISEEADGEDSEISSRGGAN